MPSFESFKFLGPYPLPAAKENVNYFGPYTIPSNEIVNQSTITNIEQSVPFWWLFYKMRFNVEWTIQPSGLSGSFDAVFTSEKSPNEKICRKYLDEFFGDLYYNFLDFGGETENSTGEVSPSLIDYFGNLEPFQCEKLHVVFFAQQETLVGGGAPYMKTYITSASQISLEDGETNILSKEVTVSLPSSGLITLNAFAVLGSTSGSSVASATADINIVDVEWWEIEE